MGTLVAKLHDEQRARERDGPKGRRLPCTRRPSCKRKWSGCEVVCGGYTSDLKGRR